MKRIIACVTAFLMSCMLTACTIPAGPKDYMGFKKTDFIVVAENDSHSGFHGDGSSYLILDCSQNKAAAEAIIHDWQPLPLSENLQLIMYGGMRNGMEYVYYLAETAQMPAIESGCYRFVDRHAKSTAPDSDDELFDRASFNFTLAVYDMDLHRLYYFEFDT